MARIVVRRGNELEKPSSQLQGAGGTEYIGSLIEEAHVKLNKRSAEGHIY
jgi:hypothetical protein